MLAAGALDEAEAAIGFRLAQDSGDAASWLLQARLLAARGWFDAAQEACARAIDLWPDILPAHRLLGTIAQRTGADSDQVERSLRMLVAAHPDDAASANRIATRLCASERFVEALPFLRIAAPVLGHGDSALWNYSTALALTGHTHELLSIEPMLVAYAREVPPPFGPFVHLAGAKLALQFDRGAVLRESAARQGSADWLDAAALAERLRQAITARRPTSVMLLSEAHARVAAYADYRTHLVLNEGELSALMDSVWTPAFGSPIETHGSVPAGQMARATRLAIETADVIGVPDAVSLGRLHEHFGFLAALLRLASARPSPLLAGLGVMIDLHEAMPFLRPLLAEQRFLGFVGSHPDLAERLARFCQIEATETVPVPAALNRTDIPAALRGAGHYPERFDAILAELRVPTPGAVFLVAAGLLGPAYCGRIKQLGGIAIDIDSLVGRWLPG